MDDLTSIINEWLRFRKDFQSRSHAPNQGEINEFVQRSNHISRRLLNWAELTNPEMIEAFAECAMHADAMVKRPSVFET